MSITDVVVAQIDDLANEIARGVTNDAASPISSHVYRVLFNTHALLTRPGFPVHLLPSKEFGKLRLPCP